MCHLFAISASEPRTIKPFAENLAPFATKENPDGWGLAAIRTTQTTLIKEPRSFASALDEGGPTVTRALRANGETLLFHLRDSSVGKNSIDNTHPFRRHFLKRSFVFMHNGTVPDVRKLPLSRLERTGETDSEHAFLWFLEAMPPAPPRNFSRWLKGESDLVRRLGKFNFVLAEGSTLWAYADTSLFYAERVEPAEEASRPARPARSTHSASPGSRLQLVRSAAGARASHAPARRSAARVVLVASCPMTQSDRWTQLAQGSLLVAKHGRVQEILQ
ncbi:MAG: class II glutamine amidotransferase [bacterium]